MLAYANAGARFATQQNLGISTVDPTGIRCVPCGWWCESMRLEEGSADSREACAIGGQAEVSSAYERDKRCHRTADHGDRLEASRRGPNHFLIIAWTRT